MYLQLGYTVFSFRGLNWWKEGEIMAAFALHLYFLAVFLTLCFRSLASKGYHVTSNNPRSHHLIAWWPIFNAHFEV